MKPNQKPQRLAIPMPHGMQIGRTPVPEAILDDAPEQPWHDDKLPELKSFQPSGKFVIVYQEPEETTSKGIVIPKSVSSRQKPVIGSVVKEGNGYDPMDDYWNAYERYDPEVKDPPRWRCPFPRGTRIVWSKWKGDIILKIEIKPGFLTEEEEKKHEGKLQFVMIHARDIAGTVGNDSDST